jgi:5S rRNA maturation endonuclease (ribonuclease M5)
MEKEDFNEFLEKLKKDSKEKIVIVEGPKDKKALEGFGIKNIIVLRKPLYLVVEHIVNTGKDCIILTDLDKKGKELYGKLASSLKQFGVNVDDKPREFLFKTKIRQIEGLPRYLGKL